MRFFVIHMSAFKMDTDIKIAFNDESYHERIQYGLRFVIIRFI